MQSWPGGLPFGRDEPNSGEGISPSPLFISYLMGDITEVLP